MAALGALSIRRVAMFSPYVVGTHQHEVEFLFEAGIEVVGGDCLGLSGGDEYIQVTPDEWLRLAQRQTPPHAEGVFLSCTNIRAPEAIEDLERLLGRPVVTSNQAVLWYALRGAGVADAVPGLGRLLRSEVAARA
jgi:maleate isomerase